MYRIVLFPTSQGLVLWQPTATAQGQSREEINERRKDKRDRKKREQRREKET